VKTLLIAEDLLYDGSQLHSHWAAQRTGFEGDCLVAFLGPCDVKREHMVDLVDLAAGAVIRAARMVHFIAEHFGGDILKSVLRQRVLVTCAREALVAGLSACGHAQAGGEPVERRGSDLYVRGRKLSVSIATTSPVSGIVHLGVNADPQSAPVDAIGLGELQVDEGAFARDVLARYAEEAQSIRRACHKARPVG